MKEVFEFKLFLTTIQSSFFAISIILSASLAFAFASFPIAIAISAYLFFIWFIYHFIVPLKRQTPKYVRRNMKNPFDFEKRGNV